jgi:hypothetical protein
MSRIHRDDAIEEAYCCPSEPKATQALKDLVRDYGGHACAVPNCEIHRHASDCALHNAPAMKPGQCDCGATPEPLYPQARAVLEAGLALDDNMGPYRTLVDHRNRAGPAANEGLRLLIAAVLAYRASTRPEGVRPETQELGTLFRHVGWGDNLVFTLVKIANGDLRYMDKYHRVFEFEPDDRIIPTKDQ